MILRGHILRKYSFVCAIAWLMLLITGCKQEMTLRDTLLWNGKPIHIEVDRIKPYQEGGKEKSLLYGSLVFEGQAEGKANLTCIVVSLNDVSSEQIYVDSVAHILPDRYIIDKDRTRIPVYWKIDKTFDGGLEGKKFKVLISPGCQLLTTK